MSDNESKAIELAQAMPQWVHTSIGIRQLFEQLQEENESLKQRIGECEGALATYRHPIEAEQELLHLKQQLAQRVPDGCKLVPVEPTDAMVQAAHHLDLSYMPGQEGADRAAIYRAMLSAAPAQPEASADDKSGPLMEGCQISVANGHSGFGAYANMTEYPEEGAVFLCAAPEQPAAQDKPFAYYQPNCPTNIMEAKLRDMEASRSDCNAMQAYAKACTEPLYTRPQPVSKPRRKASADFDLPAPNDSIKE